MTDIIPRDELLRFKQGDLVGNYRIIPKDRSLKDEIIPPLGQGGSGVVYLAEQVLYEKVSIKRAIKFFVYKDDIAGLTVHRGSGQISASTFADELVNISSVNHENIIKVVEANFWPSNHGIKIPFLVTEYIEGSTLKELIEKNAIEAALQIDSFIAVELLLQLCRGVAYLHSKRFFHFDIAPKNIFIEGMSPHFRLIIGDLGLGKTLPLSDRSDCFVAGTRAYCPPKVVQYFKSTISADVFESLQPEWDLFALIKTALDLVNSLNPIPLVRRPWQTALKRMLESVNTGTRFSSAEKLMHAIHWLHPMQQSIVQIPELTDSAPGNKRQLIPVEAVLTSRRIRQLSEHPILLRLRRVPQMPMASSVFPGANHTRYEHCLGTYENMRRVILALLDDEEFLSIFDPPHIELALVAALLSSLTRYPFFSVVNEIRNAEMNLLTSFNTEQLLDELFSRDYPIKGSLKKVIVDSFPTLPIDELFGLLLGHPLQFTESRFKIVHYLLNSSIDVRVLDYLQRDPLHTGTSKGEFFDLGELLTHVHINDEQIIVTSQGIPVVEQIVATRYWLYGRVYWNKPNRALIAMIRNAIGVLACEFGAFEKDFHDLVFREHETEKTILLHLEKMCYQNNFKRQGEILGLLSGDMPIRYEEIWQFNRAEDQALAAIVCERLMAYSFRDMVKLQTAIDEKLTKMYSLPIDRCHVLIDIPVEPPPHKCGEDINIKTHNGSTLALNKLSDVVRGAQTGFTEHLQRVRVFLNPLTYEALLSKQTEVIRIIRDFLEVL